MKIAFFTPTLSIGGYEKVVLEFSNRIATEGQHTVYIICCDDKGELKKLVDSRVKVVGLSCKTRNLLYNILPLMKSERFDIIYTGFRIYNAIFVLAKMLLGMKQTKICISQHGYEDNSPFLGKIYSLILNQADLFVAVTESLRIYEIDQLRLSCRSTVVGNPVIKDEDISPERTKSFSKDKPVVVCCGRLSKDKNFALAIDIVNCLIRLGLNVHLMILGEGPERRNLEDYVEQLELKDRIHFEGYVVDTIHYMRAGDIYLHTCDREGFGNTVVEAMFAGLPVVTTDCGGPVDLIEQDRYGKCFGNGRCLDAAVKGADAILDVLSHYEQYSGLHDKAMQYEVTRVSSVLLEEFEAIV